MTTYATYAYYTGTYLGTAIASGDFSRLAARASAQIDLLTFNRAVAIVTAGTDTVTIAAIENATCAVADELQALEDDGGQDAIVSESIGRSSVTYAESSNRRQTKKQRLINAAYDYLALTGLMFRGFADGEYSGDTDDED